MGSTIRDSLARAAAEGDAIAVRHFIAKGADVNALMNGRTALHAAVEATRHGDRSDVVDLLVSAGANLDALDQDHCTPLMRACLIGKAFGSRMALKLIQLGANVQYVRETDQASAIDSATIRAKPEVLNALIAHEAPVDGPRNSRITPLMRAVMEGNLEAVRTLVSHGADLAAKCMLPWALGKTAEEIAEQERKHQILQYLRRAREARESADTD